MDSSELQPVNGSLQRVYNTVVPRIYPTERIYSTEPMYSKYIVPISLLSIGVVLGNVSVLIAAWRNKSLRKQGKCHIVSLAVADLLVGLFLIPIRTYQFSSPSMSKTFCFGYIWTDILLETVSITTLLVISIDRCYKISYPFKYKSKVSTRICLVSIALVWFYSSVVSTLGIIPYNEKTKVGAFWGHCYITNDFFLLFAFIIAYALPCFILIVTYSLIFMVAYRRRRKWSRSDVTPGAAESSTLLKDLKNAKTLAIVVLTFMVCWGPFFVITVFNIYGPYFVRLDTHIFILVCTILPYGNSFCNPIIYAFCDKEYRKTIANVCFQVFFRKRRALNVLEMTETIKNSPPIRQNSPLLYSTVQTEPSMQYL